jgi:hypothetical protein
MYVCMRVSVNVSVRMEWDGMGWNGMEWNGMEWNGIVRTEIEGKEQNRTEITS